MLIADLSEEGRVNEEEFDSLMRLQPFETNDAIERDEQLRRCISLGEALWGKTSDDLCIQLQAPFPKIPPGYDLKDFRELLAMSARISSLNLSDRRNEWLASRGDFSKVVFVDNQRFTTWEARCIIIQRAIHHLEN